MGVTEAKSQPTPRCKATGKTMVDAEEHRSRNEARSVASAFGSALYAAFDRVDIQYDAKCVAGDISPPTRLTHRRVERLAR